jgi:hypothetical protein
MKKNINNLTQAQTESLALYLLCFKKSYYLATRKHLETVQQIIDIILDGTFTFEDVFMTYIDQKIEFNSPEGNYWDYHMEQFEFENFFPVEKNVHDGAWIKIRTENGFEIHYAKRTTRKRRFNEERSAQYTLIESFLRKQISNVKKDVDVQHTSPKVEKMKEKADMLATYELINLKPYEVFIKRSKSKTEYYMPYQYEIVDDINDFTESCMQGVVGVDIKSMGNSDNEEAVFYLRTRGISEGMARIMASLRQSYFTVDMKLAMNEYNRQCQASLVIS